MIQLLVKHAYRNRNVSYQAGEVIEVSDEQARFLMADAPGVFAPVETGQQEKSVEAAPKDKMVRRGKVTK